MKKRTLKLCAVLLSVTCLLAPLSVSAATGDVATPCYNNTVSTSTGMGINENGLLYISYDYTGIPDITTHAVITSYIEKKTMFFFWTRVDISTNDNQWVDTVYDYCYDEVRYFQLTDPGTYRVTVEYKIYGSGGAADVVPYEGTDSF